MVLAAAYFLSLTRRAFFGPVTNPVVAEAPDLTWRERLILLLFLLPVLVVGFYPSLILDFLRPAADAWSLRFR
jgi:NADH-quinone oxidoreductase subunit M